jgi:hypothetical protein
LGNLSDSSSLLLNGTDDDGFRKEVVLSHSSPALISPVPSFSFPGTTSNGEDFFEKRGCG